jgi:hypothetical protein
MGLAVIATNVSDYWMPAFAGHDSRGVWRGPNFNP